MRDCLGQVGLWGCLWVIVLTDVGRPRPLWVEPFSGTGPWTLCQWRQWTETPLYMPSLSLCSWLWLDQPFELLAALTALRLWTVNMELWAKINLFSPKVACIILFSIKSDRLGSGGGFSWCYLFTLVGLVVNFLKMIFKTFSYVYVFVCGFMLHVCKDPGRPVKGRIWSYR